MKNKKTKRCFNFMSIPVFLTRDGEGEYSVFTKEPYYDYQCDSWRGGEELFYGIDGDMAKKHLRLNRHLNLGSKGITEGLLHLGFKKSRSKKQKKVGSIFNKPL